MSHTIKPTKLKTSPKTTRLTKDLNCGKRNTTKSSAVLTSYNLLRSLACSGCNW